jgi:hypothetical protein
MTSACQAGYLKRNGFVQSIKTIIFLDKTLITILNKQQFYIG